MAPQPPLLRALRHAFARDKPDERSKECPACGLVVYPRISPAMMVLVTRGRELLLARANRFPNSMYSALAGFVEAGESIEDCIHREVLEEVGVQVGNLRYFSSQSWPFPQLADDRVHRRVRERRGAPVRRRDRRREMVRARRAAAAARSGQHLAPAHQRDDRPPVTPVADGHTKNGPRLRPASTLVAMPRQCRTIDVKGYTYACAITSRPIRHASARLWKKT